MPLPVPRSLLAAALAVALLTPSLVIANEVDPSDAPSQPAGETTAEQPADDQTWTSEAINVTARGTAADFPSALATDIVTWQDAVAAPSDFQDLITRLPGIGATGQNGLFETFSIRGSGGNGILVIVGGMPVTAQRRAGVPVAFVEPALLGDISVTRGPATVHFGPGALGGAISIEPRWFDGGTVAGGYASSGDEATLMGGFGSDSFSVAAARHQANDSESANGTPLNTSFARDSASLQYRTRIGDYTLDGLLLPSRSDDIGKSNSRYPLRDTTYPEDDHTLGRLRLRGDNGFELSVYGHDQSLLTYNQRPGSPDTYAYVESLDAGTTLQQTISVGEFSHNFGVEFLGRRDVNGFDARGSLSNRTYSLRDAEEDSWSLFGLSDWTISDEFAVEMGMRFSSIRQRQSAASADDSDQAFTAGAIWTPTEASRWTLNLSSGYRFATLEERFFSGVTPQGEIVGNPELSTESSLGVDLGYAWHADNWGTEVHVWQTNVDDLIQLFAIQPGVNGYTNVSDAKLHGVEGALNWTPTTSLSLRASGTVVRSKDKRTGDPLYGSPPPTVTLDAKYDVADFTFGAFYSHRWDMDRPGFEEVERDSVDLVDLDVVYHLNPTWNLQLYLRNALDEDYVATADVLSALGQERSVG
ncbi:MAG TPA: TonB-dependent receptor, partial [Xanthomonadales bacterium]|nr:TonB-dependent receptor [Xanthomonadales bacterium]